MAILVGGVLPSSAKGKIIIAEPGAVHRFALLFCGHKKVIPHSNCQSVVCHLGFPKVGMRWAVALRKQAAVWHHIHTRPRTAWAPKEVDYDWVLPEKARWALPSNTSCVQFVYMRYHT